MDGRCSRRARTAPCGCGRMICPWSPRPCARGCTPRPPAEARGSGPRLGLLQSQGLAGLAPLGSIHAPGPADARDDLGAQRLLPAAHDAVEGLVRVAELRGARLVQALELGLVQLQLGGLQVVLE